MRFFLNIVLGAGKEATACTRFLEDADAGLFPLCHVSNRTQ
ncbi:MAG: hypothetical protein ABFC78_07625 [Methanoregula sp.]